MIFYRFASAISAFTLLVGRFFYKIRMPEGFSLAFGHSNIIMELLYSGAIAEQKQFQPNSLQSIYFKDGSAIAGFLKKKLNSDKLTLDKSLAHFCDFLHSVAISSKNELMAAPSCKVSFARETTPPA